MVVMGVNETWQSKDVLWVPTVTVDTVALMLLRASFVNTLDSFSQRCRPKACVPNLSTKKGSRNRFLSSEAQQRRFSSSGSYKAHDNDIIVRTEAAPRVWGSLEQQRLFFKDCEQKLGILSRDQWYKISSDQIEKLGGSGLLANYYGRSLPQALAAVYPDHRWVPWLFRKVPRGFWKNRDNHRLYFEWMREVLKFESMSQWYNVSIDELKPLGVMGLLWRFYNNSLILALLSVYQEHAWDIQSFKNVPKGFWKRPDAQRAAFDNLSKRKKFADLNDWYSVSSDDLKEHKCWSIIRTHYNYSVADALRTIYPAHDWQPFKFIHFDVSRRKATDSGEEEPQSEDPALKSIESHKCEG